ncbi:ankyrin repeat protein, putative [Trichomonas vaginalis G3]|uniref:Ankyrin repeat protein, putative n=1 Tax=Trichomonas vaginalis (strain ATCC PRA-98 / G3) TaxID=412133 RepID=A2F389_TRIV3|nr:ankyrin repeat protein, putative [Trichomonas vaginalis G3]|eukprot:XP_001313577.1 ankyrin repeat protein [Trichomonas vaginalis G3]
MENELYQNYEYMGAHVKDYLIDNKLFSLFEMDEIEKIFDYVTFTADDYISFLEQSQNETPTEQLAIIALKVNVSMNNNQEAISILKSLRNILNLKFIDSLITFLSSNSTITYLKTRNTSNIGQSFKLNKSSGAIPTFNSIQPHVSLTPIYDLTKIKIFRSTKNNNKIYKFLEELLEQGKQDMIKEACEEGLAEIPDLSNTGKNVLHQACEKGNLKLVKSLIECGCNKEFNNSITLTPLMTASIKGQLEIVKYLCSIGANIDARNKSNYTPLIFAAGEGHLEVVKYLISVGANVEAKTYFDNTPLIEAIQKNHIEIVKYLITNGAKIGSSSLIVASKKGYLEIVRYLISVGADKEAIYSNNFTPLMVASMNNRPEVVRYLISVGANVEAKDKSQGTPLIYALIQGHLEVVKCLITAGANKETRDRRDQKTLLILASEHGHFEIVKYLISIGSDIGCPKVRLAQRSI